MRKRLEPAPGVLYIVGTPIGHLGDLSPRANHLLKNVSLIACEDTRRSAKLLNHFEIKVPLFSFHKHNTQKRIPQIIEMLKAGQSIALISDAGLPGISDPGEELVALAKKSDVEIICVPGPCAATTALVSSGLPSNRFCFEGFLPQKTKERKERIILISQDTRTTIIYEAPHKLNKLLAELIEVCGENRPLQVARELTKKHEQTVGTNIGEVLSYFKNNNPVGECTLVLGGAEKSLLNQYNIQELRMEMFTLTKKGLGAKEITKQLALKTGLSKRFIYSLLHKDQPEIHNDEKMSE